MGQNRFAVSSKNGWVNPQNPNQSIGIILHGYSQSMEGIMGSVEDLKNKKDLSALQIGGIGQLLFRQEWGKLSQTSTIGVFYDNFCNHCSRAETFLSIQNVKENNSFLP